MPRVQFSEENKVQKTNYNFPRLKLDKSEKARIAIIEDPVVEYRHSLDSPTVSNGNVDTKEVEARNGSTYTDYKREFISSLLCTGDAEVLEVGGVDPEGCKMCAYALENPDHIKPPQRRYAMHVIKYKTKAGSTTVATPFSVELVVWAFPDRTFNKIIELNQDWAEQGGLKAHDVFLDCTNGSFQNYDFSVAPDAAWSKNDDTKSLVKETFDNNQIPDLSIACGSRKEGTWIQNDLDKISEAWGLVNRIEGGEDSDESAGSIDESFDSIMEKSGPAPDFAGDPAPKDAEPKSKPAEKPASKTEDFAGIFDV